jgi:hypothetical protein
MLSFLANKGHAASDQRVINPIDLDMTFGLLFLGDGFLIGSGLFSMETLTVSSFGGGFGLSFFSSFTGASAGGSVKRGR